MIKPVVGKKWTQAIYANRTQNIRDLLAHVKRAHLQLAPPPPNIS